MRRRALARVTRNRVAGVARWGTVRGWFKGTLVAVVTAAVGCALVYGTMRLREEVRVQPAYIVSAESLRLVKGPAWMTPAILGELDVTVLDPAFPKRFSLLDPDVCRRIAAAYERCVWVERVERVIKHDPRVNPDSPPLEVYLKFRRPIAFVQQPDGFCLVDGHGVRLPGVYREPRLGPVRLLVITGISSSPPAAGQVWSEPALQSAVQVADAMAPRREAFRLVSVDVSNFGGRRDPRDTEIALYTTNDTRIKWGKAPSSEAALLREKTPAEKVAYLDYVYQSLEGQVDGVLLYIDIPNEAIRRRTADVTATTTRLRS